MRSPGAIVVAGIVALALALRLGYVVAQTRFAIFDVQFVAADSQLYLALGRSIADGAGMAIDGRPTAYVAPGYPLFVALLLRLGADPFGIGLVQAALGAATALIAWAITRELARGCSSWEREFASVIAGTAVATYPHLIFWTGYVLTETLFVFLVALAFLLTFRAVDGRHPLLAVTAGACAAAAALVRPPYLAVALVILAWWVVRARHARDARLSLAMLGFAVALAVPFALWAGRNLAVLGAPVLTSTESGFVFYQGNARGATGGSRGYVDERDFPPLELPADLSESERDRRYLAQAIADIAADPAATVARWPAKVVNMWRPTYAGASMRNEVVTLVTYVPALVAGTGGAVLLLRRGLLQPTALPTVFLATWFIVHVLVTGMIRFRLAAELMLLVVAPFALLAARSALARVRA